MTDYLTAAASNSPAKPALFFEGRSLTWSELEEAADGLYGYFSSKLGASRQKIVALLLTNSPEFVIIYMALLKAGHIALPLDPAYKKLELDAILDQMGPSLLITSERYINQISSDKSEIVIAAELLKQKYTGGKVLRQPADKQITSLTFTSGTSGRPKAVPHTHANDIWNIKVCSKVWQWGPDDTILLTLPLSHWYGLVMGLSGAIYHGNTLYLHQQSFEPDEMLKELSSGRISLFTHTPLGYMKLLAYQPAKKYDLSKVRLCISGSAPLPPPIWHQFKDRFGAEIIETYGSTETGRIAANSPDYCQLGSPGKVLPGVDLKLGSSSEVLVRSEGLFPGYWHNSEATKAGMTEDGYWHTGDLGELKDGYLYLKGRLQEKIRRFSYSISPRDIEWAMHKNPAVKEIYVMGRQADSENDELIFFIVTELSDDQLNEYCKQNLLFAWRPDKIIRLPEIPRNRSGKPKLKLLQELANG